MRSRTSLFRLWIVVTSLWTVSDLLRLDGHQASALGWRSVLAAWPTWFGLLVPPLVLAAVLALIRATAGGIAYPWTARGDQPTDLRR